MTLLQSRKSSASIPRFPSKWRYGIPLLIHLSYMAFLGGVYAADQTGFSAKTAKPTVALLGSNVTLVWKFSVTYHDRERLESVTFGKWSRDGTFIELKVLCQKKSTEEVPNTNTSSPYWKCLPKSGDTFTASFHLVNVTMNENTTYGCRLSFGPRRDAMIDYIQLLITAPARITDRSTSLKQFRARQSQPAALTCDVTGEPRPSVAWIREGHVIQNSTEDSTYRIQRTFVNMTGVYECIAKNPLGSDTREMLLIVESCLSQSDDGYKETKGHSTESYASKHAVVSMLAVGSVFFFISLAYCFFNYAGRTAQKNGTYRRIQKDVEQTNEHVSDWKTFSDNGNKI